MNTPEPRPETDDVVKRAFEELLETRTAVNDSPERFQGPLRRLLEVIQHISAELDVDRVLALGSRKLIDVFGAERVFILEAQAEGRFTFRLSRTFDGDSVVRPELEVSQCILEETAMRRGPILVADATTDARFAQVSSVQHLNLHSVMVAPLIAVDDLLGIIYLDNRMFVGAFDEYKLALLQIFANHLAIAMRNARLFERLRKTRAELAQAERLKAMGEVTGYIAHKIKNPLTAIRMQLSLLEENWQDEEFRLDFSDIMGQAFERMGNAIDELSKYGRPAELTQKPVRLARVIESALRPFCAEIESNGIAVEKDWFGQDSAVVLGDEELLREVFVNLIKNALEAMEGMATRVLGIRMWKPERDTVNVSVTDSGPGIPGDELKAIFEPFRTTKRSGTGLGLPYCEKIIREHGGTISAENQGQGAKIKVSLPLMGM